MMPAIYLYQRKGRRMLVFTSLLLVIACSISYLVVITIRENLPTMLNIDDNNMFNYIYRRPFGPAGYYSLGILFSIFYFEYS